MTLTVVAGFGFGSVGVPLEQLPIVVEFGLEVVVVVVVTPVAVLKTSVFTVSTVISRIRRRATPLLAVQLHVSALSEPHTE